MDLHETIASRRTVQRFAAGPVPDEVVQRALTAAHWAPNHKLTWPWHFLLPGPTTREAVIQRTIELKQSKPKGSSEKLAERVRAKLGCADRWVFVVQTISEDPFRATEDLMACSAAVQNLMLSATADGFATKWGTGGMCRDEQVFELLGLEPTQHAVVGLIQIGRAERAPSAPERPPLEQHVRRLP